MGYEDMIPLCKQKRLEPDCAIPQSPPNPGVEPVAQLGFQALNSLNPPLDEDPLYPHPHMAQQKLLGCLALPGGLFTSSRSFCIPSQRTQPLHPNLLITEYTTEYALFESLLMTVSTLS
jgi:hypothetical protein